MFKSVEVRYFLYSNGTRSLCEYVRYCYTKKDLLDIMNFIRYHCSLSSSNHVDVDVILYSDVSPYKVVVMGAL